MSLEPGLRGTRRWSRRPPPPTDLGTLHGLCSLSLVFLLHWLPILFCLPVHFLIIMVLVLHLSIRPSRVQPPPLPVCRASAPSARLCSLALHSSESVAQWVKIAHWPAPLRLPACRAQVAGLVACTCFRYLILVRSAVGVGQSSLQMWCPREDLANSKDSRVRAGYVREERQGVRGRFTLAGGPRTGECCRKTRTLEEEGSGWNPSLTVYQLGESE